MTCCLFCFAQDVTHIVGGYRPRVRLNVLGEVLSLAGLIMYGRFWLITEAECWRATGPSVLGIDYRMENVV